MDILRVTIQTPAKVSDYVGKLVESQVEIGNSMATLPPYTIFKVTSSGIVKYLESMRCDCCGLKLVVSVKAKQKDFQRMFKFIKIVGP